MDFGGSSEECIHGFDGATQRLPVCHELTASICNRAVNAQNSSFKPERQFMLQPVIKSLAPFANRQAFDAIAELSQRDYAEVNPVFIDFFQPSNLVVLFISIALSGWRRPLGLRFRTTGQHAHLKGVRQPPGPMEI